MAELNDFYVFSSFIEDCKSPITLKVFKTLVTKWTGESEDHDNTWPPVPGESQTIEEILQSDFNRKNQKDDQDKYLFPWYYFPVHIDDDVITVKIPADVNIAEDSRLYLVYDKVPEPDVSTTPHLAIVVPLTPSGGRIIENATENYIQFSLKSLSGLCCRFDTFDEDLQLGNTSEPAVDPSKNVYKKDPQDHHHSTNNNANPQLISPNDKQSILASNFSESNQDIAPDFTSTVTPPILYPDGSHKYSNNEITYNLNWIQEIGNSYYFYTDTTIANQEDDLIVVTNNF